MNATFQRFVKSFCTAAALVAAAAGTARALDAQANAKVDREKAATVKAAYLLNFVRYSQWPESAFVHPGDPIVVTQVGDCEVGTVLPDVISRSEAIGGHPLELRRVATPDAAPDRDAFLRSIESTHMLFVCRCSPEGLRSILDHVKGSNVLTVGDAEDFADRGGMLGFVLQQGRIVFEANPQAIQNSPVSVSAKVLKLARIVGEGEGE